MKTFICVENGEYFILENKSFEDAEEGASLYGGSCIRELTVVEVTYLNAGITYEQLTKMARK